MNQIPIEIIYNILLQLPYKDIINYCASNRESREICNDNIFWAAKLDYDFSTIDFLEKPLIPSQYVRKFKEVTQDIYIKWMNHALYPPSFVNNDIDAIIFRSHISGDMNSHDALRALEPLVIGDFLDELKDLFDNGILSNESYGFDVAFDAIKHNKLDILKWSMTKMNPKNLRSLTSMASSRNDIHILKWLEQNGVPPDLGTASVAAENGYVNILYWLEQRKIFPSPRAIRELLLIEHTNIRKKSVYNSSPGVLSASDRARIVQVIDWLSGRGLL